MTATIKIDNDIALITMDDGKANAINPAMLDALHAYLDRAEKEAKALIISNELLLEYLRAGEKSLRQALFTAEVAAPAVQDVNIEMKKMDGVGGGR